MFSSNMKSSLESILKLLTNCQGEISGNKIQNISVMSAQYELDSFTKIIDVRRPEEFRGELGHIKNSVLWTLQTDLEDNLDQLDSKGTYLFVCRSGGRSAKACQVANMHGLKNVFNLEGGMLAWNEQSLPINKKLAA